MRRRDFMVLLGGAAATQPFVARAQQTTIPVVGILGIFSADSYTTPMAGIRNGLNETGFVEGRNVRMQAGASYDRLLTFANDLVRRGVYILCKLTTKCWGKGSRKFGRGIRNC